MRYLSVCSGIEAASVAWHQLGWQPAGFSEIEPFPRAVLEHRQGAVAVDWDHRWQEGMNYAPLFGDFTQIETHHVGPIDVLVGGTPCQSFSTAGLRGGLADDRGNLALEFLRLADRTRPKWLVWENVPGVLSSNGGRDFGSILGGMVELGYGFAYRVLDAQFCGVPQRRRRVFVIGHLGDWRSAAAVLFERHSLSGHPPPRREAMQAVAALTANGVGTCGPDDNQAQAGHLIASTGNVAHCLNAGGMGRQDFGTETLIAHILRGEGFDASEDGTGRGIPLVPVAYAIQERAISENVNAGPGGAGFRADGMAYTLEARTVPQAVAYDLRGREGGSQFEGPHDTANIRAASGGSSRSYIAHPYAVRRLTPTECERLQGFPDGYTAIPWRKKAVEDCPDGPRYKALGNSMAVPVMRWIGERIQMVDEMASSIPSAPMELGSAA